MNKPRQRRTAPQVPPLPLAGSGRAAAAALSSLALLAACGSSPPTRYFTLQASAAPAAASVAYSGPPLRVRSVQVPPAMDRLELLQEVAPGQVDVLDFDHWAAPLGRLARQTLAEDLAARLPRDKLVFPGASWPEAAAELSVNVLSFKVADGNAVMLASWALRWPAAAAAAAPGGATGLAAAPAPAARPAQGGQLRLQAAAGAGADATARAWSDLLAQLADQVVAQLPAGGPGPGRMVRPVSGSGQP